MEGSEKRDAHKRSPLAVQVAQCYRRFLPYRQPRRGAVRPRQEVTTECGQSQPVWALSVANGMLRLLEALVNTWRLYGFRSRQPALTPPFELLVPNLMSIISSADVYDFSGQ